MLNFEILLKFHFTFIFSITILCALKALIFYQIFMIHIIKHIFHLFSINLLYFIN